jgi:hypothetical protein
MTLCGTRVRSFAAEIGLQAHALAAAAEGALSAYAHLTGTECFDLVDVPEHLELSLSSANGQDLLDALGIEETYSDTPWSIDCFRALVTLARRERLDHQSR